MRKTIMLAVVGAVALVTAAIAVAAVYTASGVSATTATFSTDKVSPVRSCLVHRRRRQGVHDHAAATTPARPRSRRRPAELSGPLTIDARTTYSTTDGLGYVEGSFRVQDSRHDPNRLGGRFTATLKGSQLVGFLTASARGHHARVLGNLSATFVPATGFTAGAVGSTSSTAVLAVVAGPTCPKAKPAPKPKPAPPAPRPHARSSTARSRRSVTAPSAARSPWPREARRPPPAPVTPPHRRRPGSPLATRSR